MHARELTIDELIAMKDKEIDLSDIPEADDEFWKNAQVVLPATYEQMAQDEKREAEALAWAEAMIGDVSHEAG